MNNAADRKNEIALEIKAMKRALARLIEEENSLWPLTVEDQEMMEDLAWADPGLKADFETMSNREIVELLEYAKE